MREADVANKKRTGGAASSRWSDHEKHLLEQHWANLCQALPNRTAISLAARLLKIERGDPL